MRHQQRVAVGSRLRDQRGADGAAGAAAIVDEERLAQGRLQAVGDDAREYGVGAASRSRPGARLRRAASTRCSRMSQGGAE